VSAGSIPPRADTFVGDRARSANASGDTLPAGLLVRRSWALAVGLILVTLVVRLTYLIWFSPYQLAGDEAYYWDCARHLSLCYYEKGPGLAWVIAAFCHILGDHEWVVRLPVALSCAAAAYVVGRLAMRASGGNPRAGLLAVVLYLFLPAFAADAQICTQDGPLILFWALLTAWGLRLFAREDGLQATIWDWSMGGFVLGLAFLFKQSALLFLAGAVPYAVIYRRRLPVASRLAIYILAASAAVLVTVSPMIVWNARHGWPTLTHTLGHLGAPGGDHDAGKDRYFSLISPLALVGAQLGAVGIPALLAMTLACRRAFRDRDADPQRWAIRLWMICASVPAIAFFVALSFVKPVIGSWPFPSYVPLVVLVADVLTSPGGDRSGRPPMGNACRIWLIYGAAGCLLISFPNVLSALPVVGGKFEQRVMKRVTGHREHATELQTLIDANHDPQGRPPLIITRYYMDTALDAFYLPGRPHVFDAGVLTGQRPTSYEFWPDNDLSSAELLGRSAVLDGFSPTRPWDRVLRFRSLRRIEGTRCFVAEGYQGPLTR
jgi:hypothetical protein